MIVLTVIFFIIIFSGFVIFNIFFKSKNKLLLLGASMITGPLVFLLTLSILSYVFKGKLFIQLIFIAYVICCLFIFLRKQRLKFIGLSLQRINIKPGYKSIFSLGKLIWGKLRILDLKKQKKLFWQNKLVLIPLIIYIFLIFLYASGFAIGADGDLYWGIATSFTRGNYPTVLPWQSNYLTVYHEGAFIVEGALRALAPVGIASIHNFFSAYLLSAILIFTAGLVREKTRSILCLLPGVLGLFLFGGPVLLVGNFQNFFQAIITSFQTSGLTGLINNLAAYPGYENFRSLSGAGASSFADLMYINFYTFGLASSILFLFIFYLQSKQPYSRKNYLLLIILSILSCSIDESFFFIEFLMIITLLFIQLGKNLFVRISEIVLLSLLTVVLFFIVQNPLRDSLFTPSGEMPRFKLLFESDNSLLQKFFYKKGQYLPWNANAKDSKQTTASLRQFTLSYMGNKTLDVKGSLWFIPDYKIAVVAIVILGLLIGYPFASYFAIFSLLSFLLSLTVVNTYWIFNNLRFANQTNQILMFGLGFLIIELLINKRNIFSKILLLIICLALIPQFLVSSAKFIYSAFVTQHSYFTVNQIDPRLAEVESIIPGQSKIVFLDNYPSSSQSTFLNLAAISRHGLFVPLFSAAAPKILNQQIGMEWYDAVNSLSPYAFKDLSISYVYIDNPALKRLSNTKIQELNNEAYFTKIKSWSGAELFKVNNAFTKLPDDEMSLKKMVSLVLAGKKVYLDKFYLSELRHIFLLQLSDKDHLIGPPYSRGGDFFMYIEKIISFEDACNSPCDPELLKNIEGIKYALMSTENDPNIILKGNFKKIASIKYVDLWENISQE